jgi:hypothetical protein
VILPLVVDVRRVVVVVVITVEVVVEIRMISCHMKNGVRLLRQN